MKNGANGVHTQLRKALENYIKSQYLGKSPLLRAAVQGKLEKEGVLYKKPFIESTPAYKTVSDGINKSAKLMDWQKAYFNELAKANLGVFSTPFYHQIEALEATEEGKDLFVSTGTGSGKTECFMWPLMSKLAFEARNDPSSWALRGVRTIIMYPMNALVSDQISRLRRLIGDPEHKFVEIFRRTCGTHSRRPQFGMYTGRTPYPGKSPRRSEDNELADTYAGMVNPATGEEKQFLSKLIKDGKLPAKEDFESFIEKLRISKHIPDQEDAELVSRFEMQQFCPDILITNYSMLEYMLLRPREGKIWDDTKAWLCANENNKLLFVIDEAHMYRGSSGGEVALLIRRLLYRLGIARDRVQFILTTASMPNNGDDDRATVMRFANDLTASRRENEFCYLTGQKERIGSDNCIAIPFNKFLESDPDQYETSDFERLTALNKFWSGIENSGSPFVSLQSLCQWMYDNLVDYAPFCTMFKLCRGNAIALEELAETVFPNQTHSDALHAVSVMLSIAPLAVSENGSVLFPARMHMLFRGIKGLFACTNAACPNSHSEKGLTLGEIYLNDGSITCKECGSLVYELLNDRRCGSLFFKGYVLKRDIDARKRTYLWHQPGLINEEEVREIHLFIPQSTYRLPDKQGNHKIQPCYLDVRSGFIDFMDDSLEKGDGIRKLYFCEFAAKGRPDVLTFFECPHCHHQLSKMRLTPFSTKGNQSFFNLIKEQFSVQPPVQGKIGVPEILPNEGRKVLLFSDSRQRAAKLARDMSEASENAAARQLAIVAIDRMERGSEGHSLNDFYDYFAMIASERHVQMFHDSETEVKERSKLRHDGAQALSRYNKALDRGMPYLPRYNTDNAPQQMNEHLIRLYCGSYNTLVDSALSWIEPTQDAKYDAIDALEEAGINISENEFLELFNAWALYVCDAHVALGHTIRDYIRERVRQNYSGYGVDKEKMFSKAIIQIMGWKDGDKDLENWSRVLRTNFLDEAPVANGKLYIDLKRVKPCFSLDHTWYRCDKCSELTPYLLKGRCPSCQSDDTHAMTNEEYEALAFWRAPTIEALAGGAIRVIDTEEHTAQLSHKDQRDTLWSKTEQYELRFQDFLKPGESPVDILSSTTTMEVGIDIGSLVAVGLRNIPPMRENYQQRAGRAGRRGASLSTIVTFCEDGPHDSLYFNNPVPMFRGDPRRPWIDIGSTKIIQRHLCMIALQAFMRVKAMSLDSVSAIEFLDEHLKAFEAFLRDYSINSQSILIPQNSEDALLDYKDVLVDRLTLLHRKRCDHPELFETDSGSETGRKSLLDALYEEGIIPTYSFPKNVVSTFITDFNGKVKYQVERGLDVAIGEYAPGRAIVVDKTTYQIGGLYYPSMERSADKAASPARAFISDASFLKTLVSCEKCGWFGLEEDEIKTCPFCGNHAIASMRPMLRPWGFAPRNARAIETEQLMEDYSAIQQPLYSTLPDSKDVVSIDGYLHGKGAVRPNQRIIMLNRGSGDKGFMICCDCGAAMPGNDPCVLKDIQRPYHSKLAKTKCKHNDAINVNLGYDFVTDMLVLEFALDKNAIETNPEQSTWIARAGQSLAEALRLAVCQELDIEFSELVTGYRIRHGKECFIDVYLYDNLSSGAGYAVSIEQSMASLLEKTQELLEDCSCENACHNCLKHYRNQRIHGMLDRKAACELLTWGKKGMRVPDIDASKQEDLLRSLTQVLHYYGVSIESKEKQLWIAKGAIKKAIVVYPAMWAKPVAEDTIYVSDTYIRFAKPFAVKTILENL